MLIIFSKGQHCMLIFLEMSNWIYVIATLLNFRYDFNVSSEQEVGKHEAPIRCVEFCSQLGNVHLLCISLGLVGSYSFKGILSAACC